MLRELRALAAFVSLAPLVAGAQARSPVGSPLWSTSVELLAVESVRELSAGDLIVLDSRRPALYLISRDGTSARSLVTVGAGPGEVQRPRGLWALTGDSTAVPDLALRRPLILAPSGVPVRDEPLPDALAQMVFGVSVPSEGTAALFPATWSPTSRQGDSVPILRWRLRSSRVDTLSPERRPRRVHYGTLQFVAPGMVPELEPPFTESGHHLDPTDRAWIRRSRRAGDSTYTYDVFSPRGVHERTLVFPNDGRIVAVTASGVYAVDRDDDGSSASGATRSRGPSAESARRMTVVGADGHQPASYAIGHCTS